MHILKGSREKSDKNLHKLSIFPIIFFELTKSRKKLKIMIKCMFWNVHTIKNDKIKTISNFFDNSMWINKKMIKIKIKNA